MRLGAIRPASHLALFSFWSTWNNEDYKHLPSGGTGTTRKSWRTVTFTSSKAFVSKRPLARFAPGINQRIRRERKFQQWHQPTELLLGVIHLEFLQKTGAESEENGCKERFMGIRLRLQGWQSWKWMNGWSGLLKLRILGQNVFIVVDNDG